MIRDDIGEPGADLMGDAGDPAQRPADTGDRLPGGGEIALGGLQGYDNRRAIDQFGSNISA